MKDTVPPRAFRARLLGCSAIAVAAAFPVAAWAQDSTYNSGLQEIVVTAQKREQSMQDVPIAVTAVTQDTLEANRIQTVNDIGSIAPGVTVRPSAGGIQTPFFTIRGQVSTGVVAGSDKQVSIYLDGVYIASPRGSIFDLPDIQRLEVLRGPQGTLFGRNATAGAISITTRDPTGEAHVRVQAGFGNYGSYRFRMSADTPQMGPFSALFSFVRSYRRGEIENSFAGLLWNRSNSPSNYGAAHSPRWLGTVDANSYFGAVKFEPTDTFKMVYKYDRNEDNGTPEGTALIAYNKSAPLIGSFLEALYTSNNVHLDPSSLRPSIVDNGWVVPRQQTVQGHSLTATWEASDHVTIKNVAAYRKAEVFSPSAIDGVSSVTFTKEALVPYATLSAFSLIGTPTGAALGITDVASATAAIPFFVGNFTPLVGQRTVLIASQSSSISKQWSDELQLNYSSQRLQATLGALWFHTNEQSGGPIGQQNTLLPFTFIPQTGVIPLANEGRSFNKSTSLAAYLQLEYKILDNLTIVGGARITKDKKSSALRYDIVTNGVTTTPTTIFTPPNYTKTKPNYLIGLNWTPRPGMLIYGKFSTSFVTGGTTYGIPYSPETAKSFELGFKADFLNHRLRTNLALFHVIYNHLQQSQGTSVQSSRDICVASLTPLDGAAGAADLCSVISTFVFDSGKLKAQGFELEVTAAPVRGVQIGGSLSYTDASYPHVNPVVLANNGGTYLPIDRPAWTGSAYASYETEPLFGSDATMLFRVDGLYQSSQLFQSQSKAVFLYPDGSNANAYGSPAYWLINGRIALQHVKLGPTEAEISLWGKNLTDRKYAAFSLPLGPLGTSANFIPPRTYGVEVGLDF